MKIAVLSDTHIPVTVPALPDELFEFVAGMDVVIHAGDFQSVGLVEQLSTCKEFYGVCGNMDPPEVGQLLPKKRIIRLEGISIGIIHGWGSPAGLEDRVRSAFKGEEIAAVVFGHSHQSVNIRRGGLLFFNPGSPTDKRFARQNSVGVLTIKNGSISGEIIRR